MENKLVWEPLFGCEGGLSVSGCPGRFCLPSGKVEAAQGWVSCRCEGDGQHRHDEAHGQCEKVGKGVTTVFSWLTDGFIFGVA